MDAAEEVGGIVLSSSSISTVEQVIVLARAGPNQVPAR